MAQDFTIGRAGLASASGGDGLELSAQTWEAEGDEARVGGVIKGSKMASATALADVKALRDQLKGYHLNTDEPVVPVTSAQDSSIDGFYRVQDIRVGSEATGRLRAGSDGNELAYTWTAELLRVPGWQAVRQELVVGGTVRTNSHSIAIGSTFPLVGAPVGAFQASTGFTTTTTVTGADGAVPVWYQSTPTTYAVTPSFLSAAGDFYKGACRLEVSYDSGSTWRTVVGRQPANLPTLWRISNSLVRVTATTTASKTELSVEHHDGSQWETAKVWQLTQDTSYTALALAPTSLTCFKNAADEVRVQVGAGTTSRVTFDVRLRRGARFVECVLVHPTVTDLGVRRGTNEAGAALSTTCGLRANANDAGGNKYVVCTPTTLAGTDTTIGAIRVSSGTFRFGLGLAVGGTVGTGFGETMGVASAYMAGINHHAGSVAVG